jgi:tetratricopeptide (TPR) repeat protein
MAKKTSDSSKKTADRPKKAAAAEAPPPGEEISLAAAIKAARAAPDSADAWQELEEAAAAEQRPDEVAALYRELLGDEDLSPERASMLGQRAVHFHEEWYGEGSAALAEVLARVLEIDPDSDWAFQRLTVVLTVGERWEELLALYDRTLAATRDTARRLKLLDEAANIAKDFMGQPDRAVGYLQQLLPLRPDDARLAQSLERLLERRERWRELVDFWQGRLPRLPADEAAAARLLVATLWLEKLDDPGAALAEVRALFEAHGDNGAGGVGDVVDESACALLERILALKTAPGEVRRGALALLRVRHDAAGRGGRIAAALRTALELSGDRDERMALHREAGDRLAAAGDASAALEQHVAVLVLDPDSGEAQERLRHLAELTGVFAPYARGLAEAADASKDPARAVELLVEAAHARAELLRDDAGAVALYVRALAHPGAAAAAGAAAPLAVARRLDELLERSDRAAERLAVLEKLATLESKPGDRRAALGRLARLADQLGDGERALAAWKARLDADAADREALDATVDLLERAQRWEPLVQALRRRVAAPGVAPHQRRADLVRIAAVHAGPLGAPDLAIEAWLEVQREMGEDAETVDALADLFSAAGRWEEVAELLERAAARETARGAALWNRLGDAARTRLRTPDRAVAHYRAALEADPRHAGARTGLAAIAREEKVDAAVRVAAGDALARAAGVTDDWALVLELTAPRVAAAAGMGEAAADDGAAAAAEAVQVRLWREAAALYEGRAGDRAAALRALCQALPLTLAPADPALERDVWRLAEATGDWAAALEAVRATAARLPAGSPRLAQLRFLEGDVCEKRLDDAAAALEAYSEAVAIEPGRTDAMEGMVRLTGRLGRPAPASAAQAGAAAAAAAGVGGAGVAQLRLLAELQRRTPGRPLLETLLRLADATPGDLDALREAAALAQEGLHDADAARPLLLRLLDEAAALWRRGARARGTQQPPDAAAWALEELARLYAAAGDHARVVELLAEGASLPFDAAAARALRLRAADTAADRVGDRARAIDLYAGVLAAAPDDAQAPARLAALYEAEERLPDLLALRRRELKLAKDAPGRLALRLEIARLVGAIEERGGRLEALRQNLAESPGHEASVEAVCAVLESTARQGELADLLTEQAVTLERQGDDARAALLWARVARLAEVALADVERALAAHRRVAALDPTPDALDALARLHMGRGEHAAAVEWLDRRLAGAEPETRVAIALSLARAHMGAGQPDRAVVALERALADDPDSAEVRDLLVELYRKAEAWGPLARVLADACAHVGDEETVLAYAREAADLYATRLGAPERALPVLERAVALVPKDRALQMQLADGLRAGGRFDEARGVLEGLVKGAGRRRTPERAAVHLMLAQVARAQGQVDEALEQLDLASSMDVSNASILMTAAELAREAGKLDRAERAFRGLLLVVRREKPGEGAMAASEVLFELSRIAEARGQPDQARELLESALATSVENDVEARRFKAALLARGEAKLLLRALDMRLDTVQEPAAKAEALAARADALEQLGRADEALDARLRALDLAPADEALHEAVRGLAVRQRAAARYADALAALADRLRRKDEAPLVADLLLRLGALAERELGDTARAAATYARVEAAGERVPEAWSALGRVARARGDGAELARVVGQLERAAAAGEDAPAAARADALFRLAELHLGAPDGRAGGVTALDRALDLAPRFDRALAIVRAAGVGPGDLPEALGVFERIARGTGDPRLLLEFIEQRAGLAGTSPEPLREGVELAGALNEPARAEALLERAVELARAQPGGLARSLWAPIALSQRRKAAGDLAGAIRWMGEVAEVGDPARVLELGLELARAASAPGGDLPAAARMYERLQERDPTDRRVWEPLADVYARLGDRARLDELVATTTGVLLDAADRSVLRVARARFLQAAGAPPDEVVDILRDVLMEEPEHSEAVALLAGIYEGAEQQAELADLLSRQLAAARERGDAAAVTALARRLGAQLERSLQLDEAKDVYRGALELAPGDRGLLDALLGLFPEDEVSADRAAVLEQLLALDEGEAAVKRAAELEMLWSTVGDDAGVQRALEAGRRAAPADEALRKRLERWYREHQEWARLAALLADEAARRKVPAEAVALWREAAALQRDRLGDVRQAADLLRRACAAAPGDAAPLDELARTLAASGDAALAAEADGEVSRALQGDRHGRAGRVHLLRLRAELRAADAEAALADLEAGYALAPDELGGALLAALQQRKQGAAAAGDRDAERGATLRLAHVLGEAGDGRAARALLAEWVGRQPGDRDAVLQLRDMDEAAGRWDDVAAACQRLVLAEQGDAQIDAAVLLADAYARAGRAADARGGLEYVFQAQPQAEPVRALLRQLYEQLGARRELAEVLRSDADHAPDPTVRLALLRHSGELLLAVGDGAAAAATFEAAVKEQPGDFDLLLLLVDAYVAGGRLAEANDVLTQLTAAQKSRRSPKLAAVQHRHARVARALGDRAAELDWLKQAFDIDKKNNDLAAELADLAEQNEDWDLALKALQAVTLFKSPGQLSPAAAFLRQARIAHRRAEAPKAVQWAKRALQEDPHFAEATEFLRQLGEG